MKKKILSFMLSLLFILPCAFVLAACGETPPPDSIDEIDKLSAAEWNALLNDKDFGLTQGMQMSETKGLVIEYYGDDYWLFNNIADRDPRYDESDNNQNHDNFYRKNVSGGNTTYQRVVQYFDTDTLTSTWEVNSINAAKYDSNVKDVKDLINWVKDNQSKFTEGNFNVENGKLPGYKLDIAGSGAEDIISNVLTVMGLEARLVDFMFVHKHSKSLTISYQTTDIFSIHFNYNRVSTYDYKLVMDSLKSNVKMIAGEETDDDYSIFHITDAGFHIEYPNHQDTDTSPRHSYIAKLEDDTYLTFYKVADNWNTMILTGYEDLLNSSFKSNTGNLENRQQYFYWGENKIYTKESYTYTLGSVTYEYSDMVINIDENNCVTSMSWTMTTPNAILDVTLSPTTDEIEFPVVES
ncbi:MAG: hypothetical protein J6V40_05115 [Clostridia bacterium]|nr:hypothetical protein [Clostridia bacterium]